MPQLGQGAEGEGQTSTLVRFCVDFPLLCFINSGSFFLPFCLVCFLLNLLKISFLDSLKVKITFLHVSLAPAACRLHLIPGKSSRWFKTGLEERGEQKFPSATCL